MTLINKISKKSFYQTLFFSIWLPVLIVLTYFFRFVVLTSDEMPMDIEIAELLWDVSMMILYTYPSAIPVTILLQLCAKNSRKTVIITGIFVVPISTYAALVGGLFGPLGVFLYVQIVTLPAWFLLALFAIIRRYKNRPMA